MDFVTLAPLRRVRDDVFGLIFLSRWTPAEAHNDAEKVPTDIWFANQVLP